MPRVSEQSAMTAEPSTVVASSESSTNRVMLGTSSENTPSPTLIGDALNSARSPIQNFTRRFGSRVRTSEITRNAQISQYSR